MVQQYDIFFSRHADALRILVLIASLALMSSCSSVNVRLYQSPDLSKHAIRKIAVMPLVITAAAQTQVAATYSPQWITETYTTTALSASEYHPAEQAFMKSVEKTLSKVKLVYPGQVDKEMRSSAVRKYQDAIASVANHFKADAVLSFRIRNVNLQSGTYQGGGSTATGHIDLSLYSAAGDELWSASAEAFYKTGFSWSPAPSLDAFVDYVMTKMEPHLEKLSGAFYPE